MILSGLDTDGALALGDVKKVGGITFVQKAETAAQQDMPQAAIATGHVDQVLSVKGIAVEIARIARQSESAEPDAMEEDLRMQWRQAHHEMTNLQKEVDYPTFSRFQETQNKLLEATKTEADKCRHLVLQLREHRHNAACGTFPN